MVELARRRGVDARVGDAQDLPFDDGEFDCAVAAWMLYHVPDVDRAIAELARVLRPGGRLVAVTNSQGHLAEIYDLLGQERPPYPFSSEDGEARCSGISPGRAARCVRLDQLSRSRRRAGVRRRHGLALRGRPAPTGEGSVRVRRAPTIFVAENA
jgi:SAM-dependent methyltransferase